MSSSPRKSRNARRVLAAVVTLALLAAWPSAALGATPDAPNGWDELTALPDWAIGDNRTIETRDPNEEPAVGAVETGGFDPTAAFPGFQSASVDSLEPAPCQAVNDDLCKIDHIVIIVQENRSFDHYFGTYKSPSGANVAGIPAKPSGAFKPCIPHPILDTCVKPFKTTNPVNKGGPHAHITSTLTVNNGKMDGAIVAALRGIGAGSYYCVNNPFAQKCKKFNGPAGQPDLMSTMNRKVLPNYWKYADKFVLADHMFGPVDSWSLPAHLFLVSGWAADCPTDIDSCRSDVEINSPGPYKWTPITYLLDQQDVSWKNYMGEDTDVTCPKWPCQAVGVPGTTPWIWNPLPGFVTVQNKNLNKNQPVSELFEDLDNGTLPEVSWVLPDLRDSEHPAHGSMQPGQTHVTKLINAIGSSSSWDSTAIFVVWDDWGGFYDHIEPPKIDQNGYGLRVPALVISPYAKQGYIDHQTLSFDAYLKFIEDRFLGGERLPGDRKDHRPTIREDVPRLGDLTSSFDFTQAPRDPLILDPTPPVPRIPKGVSDALFPNRPL